MSPSPRRVTPLADATVLLVGAGGLGCPAGRVLARSGVGRLVVSDDDQVEGTNLHRQVLFRETDLGQPKAEVAAARLRELGAEAGHAVSTEARLQRFLPETAAALLDGVDLVVEGSDNFPSKFVVADACMLAGVPVVQAGAVRWGGWARAAGARRGPSHDLCLRCVFEEVPTGDALTCELAGVVGPVVGVLGALQAKLALGLLNGEAPGTLMHYEGRRDRLRETHPVPRAECPHAREAIDDLAAVRYVGETNEAPLGR